VSYKDTVRSIKKKIKRAKWRYQNQLVYLKFPHSIVGRELDILNKKFLVVAPHSDDEYVGCYRLLSQQNDMKKLDVFCVGLTGYEKSQDIFESRKKEFMNACKKKGVNGIFCINGDWKTELCSLYRKNNYDYVAVPSLIDWHWEHREVSKYVLSIVKENTSILFYQVSVPISYSSINSYLKYDKYSKWDDFYDSYPSQYYMPVERFRITDNSQRLDRNIIEPYWLLSYNQIPLFLNRYTTIEESRLNDLKNHINNLYKIRSLSKTLYELLSLC